MTKKQQQFIAFGAMAIFLLVVGAFLFGIKPQLSHRSENRAATAMATQKTMQLNSQLASLSAKQAALPKAQADMKKLETQFPSAFNQDAWINLIRQVAARSHVTVESVTVTQPVDAVAAAAGVAVAPPAAAAGTTVGKPTPITVPPVVSDVASSSVQIAADGNPAQLDNFLKALETMPRPLLIGAVSGSYDPKIGTWRGSVSGTTFMMSKLDDPTAAKTTS